MRKRLFTISIIFSKFVPALQNTSLLHISLSNTAIQHIMRPLQNLIWIFSIKFSIEFSYSASNTSIQRQIQFVTIIWLQPSRWDHTSGHFVILKALCLFKDRSCQLAFVPAYMSGSPFFLPADKVHFLPCPFHLFRHHLLQ